MNSVFDALSPRQRTDLLLVFHIIQLSGAVGLGLVLFTIAFAKSLKPRHPLAINMMFCWFLYALISCLLLFSGRSSQLEIPFALCLADAAIVNGVTMLTAVSCDALVIHLWINVQSCMLPEGKLKTFLNSARLGTTHILLILPYISFVAWTVFLLVIGLHYPEAVSRRWAWFYCSIEITTERSMGWVGNITAMVVGGLIIVAVILERLVFVVKALWKRRVQMRSLNASGWDKFLFIRLGIFTTFSVCMLLSVVAIIFFPTQVIRHIFLATPPLVAFIIFGPQRDLLACWFGWLPSYLRRLQPGRTAGPMAATDPYPFRPHTPTVRLELFAPLKEKASPPSDHQHSSPVARTGVGRYESHSPDSLASHVTHVTMAVPVLNQSTFPISQAPIPRGVIYHKRYTVLDISGPSR